MGLITDPSSGRNPISGASANLGEADERIDRIYYDFDKISYFLGYENEKRVIAKSTRSASGLELFPVHLNIPNNEHQASTVGRRPTDDGTLIFLALVVSSIRNTARATAKIRACDVLLAFSERITDEAKLDRVLPYLVALLNDKSRYCESGGDPYVNSANGTGHCRITCERPRVPRIYLASYASISPRSTL